MESLLLLLLLELSPLALGLLLKSKLLVHFLIVFGISFIRFDCQDLRHGDWRDRQNLLREFR